MIVTAGVPDLTVTSVAAPVSVAPRGVFRISWTVANNGTGRPIGNWSDSIYLSADENYDSGDTLLVMSAAHPAIVSAGRSYTDSADVALPARTPGDYFLIVRTDDGNSITESDESNNSRSSAIQVTRLLSLIAAPDTILISVNESSSASASFDLTSLADGDLTDIVATATNLPANLDVTVTPEQTTLSPQGSGKVSISVSARDASIIQGGFDINITTAEQAEAAVHADVTVVPRTPLLVVAPSLLAQTMVRGAQTLVEFSVTNNGQVPANGLQTLTPDASWLSLSTPAEIGTLEPGASAKVVLNLKPAVDQTLGDYTGAISLRASNTEISVPFAFRAVSSGFGNLKVVAVDEFTYFADDHPNVAGQKSLSPIRRISL